jgi:5-methylthioadenosine/S-adenosylhomocysteine deaminase
MVAGKIVVENGKLLTADLQDLIRDMNEAVPDLFRRRAEWLATHKSVNELVKGPEDS